VSISSTAGISFLEARVCAEEIVPSALVRELCRREMFDDNVACKVFKFANSLLSVCIVCCNAACCEERGCKAEELWEICWWRELVRR
jgi:hypothetical protein